MIAGTITYLRRSEIDPERWNACIDASANGLVYAYTHYLDHLSPQWDALVLDDYKALMPLPWKRKWGFRYLYQPPFTQQLGIISPEALPSATVQAFLETLQQHFRFAEIFLNYGNRLTSLPSHNNFILPLAGSYDELRKRYKNGLPGRMKIVERRGLAYQSVPDAATVVALYRQEYAARTPHVTAADYDNFLRLCHHFQQAGELVLRGIPGAPGDWLSAALLLRKKDRLYFLMSVTPAAGRKLFANHLLIDRIIAEFAGSGCTLDFEGSDIPGIAHFYRSFGSINQPYYFYQYNRLPWWCRWMKG